MALPTDTYETFDAKGLREDLSDIIYAIDSTETPFIMMAGRETASGIKHEWQVDQLSAAAANAQIEGDDPSINAAVPTIRVSNHCQISSKTIAVTGTLEAVDKAGRESELSYQLAKRSKELKRDIEHTCVGVNNTAVARTNDGGAAGESASVSAFFDDNLANTGALLGTHESRSGSTSTGWNGTVFNATGGTPALRALLESDLKSVIQGAWTNGGNPSVVMTGPFNKTVISSFTGNSTRFDKGEDKRLTASIDVYVSDLGEHTVVANLFQRSADVFAFTPELWSLAYLRDFRQHALSKTGDSEKRQLLCEWTLVGRNQSGNGVVSDLTGS
jgi:hypothetical protein